MMPVFLGNDTFKNSEEESLSALSVYDTIPSHIINDSENFIEFLRDYHEFLNQRGFPINVITNMVRNTSIDRADEEFINDIMSEIAADLPKNIIGNKRTFYKRIVDFYNTKGTIECIRTFFRVFYDDVIDISYPINNTFTLGDNIWDANKPNPIFVRGVVRELQDSTQRVLENGDYRLDESDIDTVVQISYGGWVNTRSFLSADQFLTDGVFYQPYSYVIETGQNISQWRYVYNKICHPAGFIFFSEVKIFVILTNNQLNLFRIPTKQPGFSTLSSGLLTLLVEIASGANLQGVEMRLKKIVKVFVDNTVDTVRSQRHFHDMYFSFSDIRQYYQYNVQQIDSLSNLPGTFISSNSELLLANILNENNEEILTEDGNSYIVMES